MYDLLSFLPYEMERNLRKAIEQMLKFHCRVPDQMSTLTLNAELQVQFAFFAFKRSVWLRQSFSFQAPSSASSDGSSVLQPAVERHGTNTTGNEKDFKN